MLVPEVVQTSAMDCGPACLKAMLAGFGIPVSYDRLRDVCQTEIDGTSIDTIEQAAIDLGLDAEQIVVPVDHLLVPKTRSLPAVVVVRLPNGLTHFVIVWSVHAARVQIMDPAHGRQWQSAGEFRRRVHTHGQIVPAESWRQWAGSAECQAAMRYRARQVQLPATAYAEVLAGAMEDGSWRGFALLDAALRMMAAIVKGANARGATSARILAQALREARSAANPFTVLPPDYWSVLPVRSDRQTGEQLLFRGAVVLRVLGRRQQGEVPVASEVPPGTRALSEAVRQSSPRPITQLIRFLRMDGLLAPATIAAALVLSSAGVFMEALLYRAFVDLPGTLQIAPQRLGALSMLVGFAGLLLFLDVVIARGVLAMGRGLELRIRAYLLGALPRLPERYFGSRLVSDMAERSHAIHGIRGIPMLGTQFLRQVFALAATLAGIAWLDPGSIAPAAMCALVATALPVVTQPILSERDLRFRTHAGGLCRFYLDALRGLIPARAHAAEGAIQCEHEELLVSWMRAGLARQRVAVALSAAGSLINLALVGWLVVQHIVRQGQGAAMLLLIYWALNVPALASSISMVAWQYPRQKNVALRLLDPLRAGDAKEDSGDPNRPETTEARPTRRANSIGVALRVENVAVRATGHTTLEDTTVELEPGEHVCIVGRSGAGKSTFVGLFLGTHSPSAGRVLVDGKPFDGPALEALRSQTAWVDPSVQLWNRSLLDNLQYGARPESSGHPGRVMETVNLLPLLQALPEGMQTRLGECGALVSGGEGQRVRLGRAMMRQSPRLVILDEAFNNLDRAQRRELMRRARRLWHRATLLCVTHDVDEALAFDRVLVFEGGRLLEDGSPAALAKQCDSRFHRLLEAEEAVRARVWSGSSWRKIRLEHGCATESPLPEEYADAEPITRNMLARSAVGRSAGGAVQAGEAGKRAG